MRINIVLLSIAALLFVSALSANAQGVAQVVAGPNGNQFRIVATFVPQTPDDTWKMQSFILDSPPVKQGQQPAWIMLDLTTTSRNLDTDAKKQRFLLLRWTPNGVEAQCSQGWIKSTGVDVDKIMEATRALYQLAPVETPQPTHLQIPKYIEQKIAGVLNNLETSKMQCIQDSSSAKP